MRFLLIPIIIAGGIMLYNKYTNHMEKFHKDDFIIKHEKAVYNEKIKENKTFEDNVTIELKKVKETNDKIKVEPTGVDFSPGNHILTI